MAEETALDAFEFPELAALLATLKAELATLDAVAVAPEPAVDPSWAALLATDCAELTTEEAGISRVSSHSIEEEDLRNIYHLRLRNPRQLLLHRLQTMLQMRHLNRHLKHCLELENV